MAQKGYFQDQDDDRVIRPGLRSRRQVLAIASVMLLGMVVVIPPLIQRSRGTGEVQIRCPNTLKMIGLALHNYAEAHDAFPPAYTVDANGRRLHSWRTLILPFMSQPEIYEKLDLSKPWDAPENRKALRMPNRYFHCSVSDLPRTQTTFLAIVTPDSLIQETSSRPYSAAKGPLAKTVMVIEADEDHAVHWASPYDVDENVLMSFDEDSRVSHSKGMHILLADGSVLKVSDDMPASERRKLIAPSEEPDLFSDQSVQ